MPYIFIDGMIGPYRKDGYAVLLARSVASLFFLPAPSFKKQSDLSALCVFRSLGGVDMSVVQWKEEIELLQGEAPVEITLWRAQPIADSDRWPKVEPAAVFECDRIDYSGDGELHIRVGISVTTEALDCLRTTTTVAFSADWQYFVLGVMKNRQWRMLNVELVKTSETFDEGTQILTFIVH